MLIEQTKRVVLLYEHPHFTPLAISSSSSSSRHNIQLFLFLLLDQPIDRSATKSCFFYKKNAVMSYFCALFFLIKNKDRFGGRR